LHFEEDGIHIQDSRTKQFVDSKYNITKIVKKDANTVVIYFENKNQIIVYLDSGKRLIIFDHHQVEKQYSVSYPLVVAKRDKVTKQCGCEELLHRIKNSLDVNQCECENPLKDEPEPEVAPKPLKTNPLTKTKENSSPKDYDFEKIKTTIQKEEFDIEEIKEEPFPLPLLKHIETQDVAGKQAATQVPKVPSEEEGTETVSDITPV